MARGVWAEAVGGGTAADGERTGLFFPGPRRKCEGSEDVSGARVSRERREASVYQRLGLAAVQVGDMIRGAIGVPVSCSVKLRLWRLRIHVHMLGAEWRAGERPCWPLPRATNDMMPRGLPRFCAAPAAWECGPLGFGNRGLYFPGRRHPVAKGADRMTAALNLFSLDLSPAGGAVGWEKTRGEEEKHSRHPTLGVTATTQGHQRAAVVWERTGWPSTRLSRFPPARAAARGRGSRPTHTVYCLGAGAIGCALHCARDCVT